MGREQRRRQLAGPIATEGDLERVRCACECLLVHLQTHRYVLACYSTWSTGRDLPRLMRVRVSDLFPAQEQAARQTLFTAICRPPSEAEWTAVGQVVEGMGVPCWRWVTSTLLKTVFPVRTYNFINPSDAKFIALSRAGQVPLPRGHIPQARGSAVIRQHVGWWYRHKVEGIPIQQLEREDAAAHPDISRGSKGGAPSRSRVYDGIDLAENLLKRMLDEDE